TWTSSGLETALFNMLTLAWLWVFLYADQRPRPWIFALSLLAALTALARPEGTVFVAATFAGLALAWRDRFAARRDLAAAAPLLIVPAHLAWRRWVYDDWLPNPYYAKTTGIWPMSGLRYLLCFLIEYSLWITLALGLAWAWRWARSGAGARVRAPVTPRTLRI